MTASVATAYISASANRYPRVGASSPSSLIAFGSSKFVALWEAADSAERGVSELLPGHGGVVTCVRFAEEGGCILSGDDKGVLKCWMDVENRWIEAGSVEAHTTGISALATFENVVATGSSDSAVKIWYFNVDESDPAKRRFTIVQTIDLKGKYPLDLQIEKLPGSQSLILAIASTDRNISIWVKSGDNFIQSASLSGHEDWIKSLSFQSSVNNENDLVLASGSQDGTIRLWSIETMVKDTTDSSDALSDDLLDSFEAALAEVAEGEEGGRQISVKRHILTTRLPDGRSQKHSISFDALLIGHEAGITSLAWRPRSSKDNVFDDRPTLLSTSTDSSVILWSPSPDIPSSTSSHSHSLWINRQRFGDVGGQRLGGFVGGLWAAGGREALAWGWGGGWRRWRCEHTAPTNGVTGHSSISEDRERWSEIGAISGHSVSVRGIAWSPGGEYLLSTGLDQTTRAHANISQGKSGEIWHEIGRPQIHGYDMVGSAFLDLTKFVSIADEKVARVFEAPRTFLNLCEQLQILSDTSKIEGKALGAAVPPLGLSNKAINQADTDEFQIIPTEAMNLSRRPYEAELLSSTLWPETEKIFGHGYELISLAVSHSGSLLCTACKATTLEHAAVRVYDTKTWQPVGQPLQGHTLTVTRIAFSPDDRYILTASRDRAWRLFALQEGVYVPVAADKSHARIIWDCAWALEGDVFATASRDKTVKLWKLADLSSSPKKWTAVATIKTPEAATTVAFSPSSGDGRRRMAIGMENGHILLCTSDAQNPGSWVAETHLSDRLAHGDHIYQLAWRPWDERNGNILQLASCSEDGTLRITSVTTPVTK